MNLPDKIEKHQELVQELNTLKDLEMSMRIEIVEELASNALPGTHKFTVEGMKVKIKKGVRYSFSQPDIRDAVDDGLLNDDELDLLRTSYDLRLKDYKLVKDHEDIDLDHLEELLIVKPSAPTIEVTLGD